jgi:hypothetical protein
LEKCFSCQFYDRRNPTANDGKGSTMWGQCRRTAPLLHPLNAKSYMVEGVWPHVRDDDWCGEWKAAARRTQGRVPDLMTAAPLSPVAGVRVGPHVQPPVAASASPAVSAKATAIGAGSD